MLQTPNHLCGPPLHVISILWPWELIQPMETLLKLPVNRRVGVCPHQGPAPLRRGGALKHTVYFVQYPGSLWGWGCGVCVERGSGMARSRRWNPLNLTQTEPARSGKTAWVSQAGQGLAESRLALGVYLHPFTKQQAQSKSNRVTGFQFSVNSIYRFKR